MTCNDDVFEALPLRLIYFGRGKGGDAQKRLANPPQSLDSSRRLLARYVRALHRAVLYTSQSQGDINDNHVTHHVTVIDSDCVQQQSS